jgi:hypothetical protein
MKCFLVLKVHPYSLQTHAGTGDFRLKDKLDPLVRLDMKEKLIGLKLFHLSFPEENLGRTLELNRDLRTPSREALA